MAQNTTNDVLRSLRFPAYRGCRVLFREGRWCPAPGDAYEETSHSKYHHTDQVCAQRTL